MTHSSRFPRIMSPIPRDSWSRVTQVTVSAGPSPCWPAINSPLKSWSMSRSTWQGSARASPISAPIISSRRRPSILADALLEAGVGAGQIAIELDYMPAQDYIRLSGRLPHAKFVPCRELYFNARMIKTDEEIAVIKDVGELTDRVIGEILREIRPGMTEKSVAQMIGNKMLEGGCDGLKCQVGSGVRSGITNCSPTDKAIEQGDIIRVEVLGDMKYYRSNVTRTAVLGSPTDEQRGIWDVMIGARETCKSMLKPGTAVADLYRAYVKYLRDRGIEPTLKFLGHGIGQTIHEEPYITDTRTVVLEPNITCT